MARILIVIVTVLVLGLTGCASAPVADTPPEPPPPKTYDLDTFKFATRSDVLIGGQPSEQAIAAFADRGGHTVINLRTPEELERLPNYASMVQAANVRYVHLPVSGSTMGPDHYVQVKRALNEATGPVLLHCASGGRATYLWAMRIIDERDVSGDEAAAWCFSQRGKAWEEGDDMLRAFAAAGAEPSPVMGEANEAE